LPSILGGAAVPAGEAYDTVVCSAQGTGNNPLSSHCFATFARIAGEAPDRVELRNVNRFSIQGHQPGVGSGLSEPDGRPTLPVPGENRTTREALELLNGFADLRPRLGDDYRATGSRH
jgi:hypothetical protein